MAINILSLTDSASGNVINISESQVLLVEEDPTLKSRVSITGKGGGTSITLVDEMLANIKAQSTLLYNATVGGTNILLNSSLSGSTVASPGGGTIITGGFGNQGFITDENIGDIKTAIDAAGGPQFAGTVNPTVDPNFDLWAADGGNPVSFGLTGFTDLTFSLTGPGIVFAPPSQTDPYLGTATPYNFSADLGLVPDCNPGTDLWAMAEANGLVEKSNIKSNNSLLTNCTEAPPNFQIPLRHNQHVILDSSVRTHYEILRGTVEGLLIIIDINRKAIGGRQEWSLGGFSTGIAGQYAVLDFNVGDDAWDLQTNVPTGVNPQSLELNWWRAQEGRPLLG
jgi:hypothetical protein